MHRIPRNAVDSWLCRTRVFDAIQQSLQRQIELAPHVAKMTRLKYLYIGWDNALLSKVLELNPALVFLKLHGADVLESDSEDSDLDEELDEATDEGIEEGQDEEQDEEQGEEQSVIQQFEFEFYNHVGLNNTHNPLDDDNDNNDIGYMDVPSPISHISAAIDMLSGLSNLRMLHLTNFVVDGESLYCILRNMAQLERLELLQCVGNLDPPPDAMNLPLERLCIVDHNDLMVSRLRYSQLLRYLPNLREVTFCEHRSENAAALCKVLQSACPKLKIMALQAKETMWMAEMLKFAPMQVEELRLSMLDMSPIFALRLAARSQVLVNIELVSARGSRHDALGYLSVLTSCPNLKYFRAHTPITSSTLAVDILAWPWICSQLIVLEFQGLKEYPEHWIGFLTWDWEVSYARKRFVETGFGTKTFCAGQYYRRIADFHERLLWHVENLENLREVIVSDSRYTRPLPKKLLK
ncbi:hypothetical protein BGZ50_003792 [Haplosporangium sp. Z 11]|nr:hypothetical protein BGZ50_003792 [Haplosporangium sp. Z 11]